MAIHDVIGMCGVLLILIAYFLLQLEKLSSNDLSYSNMNLLGAILILISLYFDRNLSSIVIEFAWMTISIIGIVRALRRKK